MTTRTWTGPAVQFDEARTLESLAASEKTIEGAGPGEVVVEIKAAAVNRSDTLNALGVFPNVPTGRIPGRDFAGTVVDGPSELLGKDVWGTGSGDLGLARDGTHARYIKLPADAVVERPDELDMTQAGAAGLAYFGAASALTAAGPIAPDTNVLVIGAAGGVGGAVSGLLKAAGARVIGVVRDADSVAEAREQGADVVIDIDSENLEDAIRAATEEKGLGLIIDTVGPPVVNDTLHLLAMGGRLVLITAPQGGALEIDVLDFYRRALNFVGVNTLRYDASFAAKALRDVLPAIRDGHLKPPRIGETMPLAKVSEAYAKVSAGGHNGRIVLV